MAAYKNRSICAAILTSRCPYCQSSPQYTVPVTPHMTVPPPFTFQAITSSHENSTVPQVQLVLPDTFLSCLYPCCFLSPQRNNHPLKSFHKLFSKSPLLTRTCFGSLQPPTHNKVLAYPLTQKRQNIQNNRGT